ncbi:hypothetical protein [Thermosipho sp. (in: thermotogales)]|jgi:hypothetical protein|uniref:hypothetical protein n=1 Tax=Thermosipho sp. (in: thermotogales) TaxID=1968895 RepID=UPI00258010CE|nr:hypothetical protein [Thermosipho sp. (in: thermotogales)]MBZ4649224.1 hypothetical protein [Thermosipho sp. (in: thermotogales)]
MAFRFDAKDIEKLPEHVKQKMIEADPTLVEELYPYHWTGIEPTSYTSFKVVLTDHTICELSIYEYIEINPKIKEIWSNYLHLCYISGEQLVKMPKEWEKEIFKLLGLEEIWKEERESNKYEKSFPRLKEFLKECIDEGIV